MIISRPHQNFKWQKKTYKYVQSRNKSVKSYWCEKKGSNTKRKCKIFNFTKSSVGYRILTISTKCSFSHLPIYLFECFCCCCCSHSDLIASKYYTNNSNTQHGTARHDSFPLAKYIYKIYFKQHPLELYNGTQRQTRTWNIQSIFQYQN